MMANQLNLLEMPSPEPSGQVPQPAGLAANESAQRPKSIGAFLRMRYNAMHPGNHLDSRKDEQTKMQPPESGRRPFFFVAFNDPYDVLSYKITDDEVQEYAKLQWVALDNFAPRNAPDWFWLYESPADAHDGYKNNSHVVAVVVDGYHKGRNPAMGP